jgi:hypothetical protein
MWGSSAELLIGLAATIFAVVGLCCFGYAVSVTRERLRHRVDLLALAGRQPAGTSRGRRTRASGALGRLTATALRGDELEFARRLELLHIRADLAPRLFMVLRLAVGFILPTVPLLFSYYYFNGTRCRTWSGWDRRVPQPAGSCPTSLWTASLCTAGAPSHAAWPMQSSSW